MRSLACKVGLLIFGFAGVVLAGPAGPPAGVPILNQSNYQKNSQAWVDTFTVQGILQIPYGVTPPPSYLCTVSSHTGRVFFSTSVTAGLARVYYCEGANGWQIKSSTGGAGGGSTVPGGLDTYFQYNNAGVFGGSANLTTNGTTVFATIEQISSVTVTSQAIFQNIATTTWQSVSTMTFSDGVLIDFSQINNSTLGEGLLLPQSTDCSGATREGQICWDTDDDILWMGGSINQVLMSRNTLQPGTTMYVSTANVAGQLSLQILKFSDGTTMTTAASGSGGGGGGYALEPATVTIQANQGITGTTVTVNSISVSSIVVVSRIIIPLTPLGPTEATSKSYVDGVARGLSVRMSVIAASTGPIAVTGLQTIDGYTTLQGDRVLVKNQSSVANGIYLASSTAWPRATDYDEDSEVIAGTFVAVTTGTTNRNTQWVQITSGPVVGISTLTFTQLSQQQIYTAGAGLTISNFVFSIANQGVNLTTMVTSTLPVANGGTGLVSLTQNGVVYASGTTAMATTAAGANGTYLRTAGGAPFFSVLVATDMPASVMRTDKQQTVSSATVFAATTTFTQTVTASAGIVFSTGVITTLASGVLRVNASSAITTGNINPATEINSGILASNIQVSSVGAQVLVSSFPRTGVIAGTYGSATLISTFTVNAQGMITQAGTIAAAGGAAAATLAVGTGTATSFTTNLTSPTVAISFLGSQFSDTTSGTTHFVNLNLSSVTVEGKLVAGSNITLTPAAGSLTIAATSGGSSIYNATSTAGFPFGFSASTAVFTSSVTIPYLAATTISVSGYISALRGTQNEKFGFGTLGVLTSGSNNFGAGYNALQANTTASFNTGVGSQALYNNNGAGNTAFGYNSLAGNAPGANNTAIGINSQSGNSAISSGNSNTSVGASSLLAITTGSANTAIGLSALTANTGGVDNTSVGTSSLLINTMGNRNVAVGREALQSNATGIGNTAVGYQSFNALSGGSFNTAVGQSTGGDSLFGASGSSNTYIGYQARPGTNNISNATAIGANAVICSSNAISLGVAGIKVGIGIATPTASMDVTGGDIKGASITATGFLQMPASTSLVTNATGQIALDMTDDTLIANDSSNTQRVFGQSIYHYGVTLSTVAGGWSNLTIPLPKVNKDMACAITQIDAATFSSAASTITFQLEYRAGNALLNNGTSIFTVSFTSGTTTGSSYTSASFSNPTVTAGAYLVFKTGAAAETGSPTSIIIDIWYRKLVE